MELKISGYIRDKSFNDALELKRELELRISSEKNKIINEYIKLCIRPKPKWLPYFIYKFLLKKLIFIEVLNA